MEEYIAQQEVTLNGQKHLAYIKRVASKIENGEVTDTVLKAFIRKI